MAAAVTVTMTVATALRPNRQTACRSEGVKTVACKLNRRDVVTQLAGLYALSNQIPD